MKKQPPRTDQLVGILDHRVDDIANRKAGGHIAQETSPSISGVPTALVSNGWR